MLNRIGHVWNIFTSRSAELLLFPLPPDEDVGDARLWIRNFLLGIFPLHSSPPGFEPSTLRSWTNQLLASKLKGPNIKAADLKGGAHLTKNKFFNNLRLSISLAKTTNTLKVFIHTFNRLINWSPHLLIPKHSQMYINSPSILYNKPPFLKLGNLVPKKLILNTSLLKLNLSLPQLRS